MSRLGFGWMGSKNKIAQEIVALLPPADVFVDLFAGGCSMTHAAMLSGKYKRFIANDIKGTAVFFKQAIEGRVPNLYEWISRDEFNARKDHDVKVAAAWSFGNKGDSYLYHKEKEEAYRLLFNALAADTLRERALWHCRFIKHLIEKRGELEERQARVQVRQKEVGDLKEYLRGELRRYLKEAGKTQKDVDRWLGTNGMAGHYFNRVQWEFPPREKYDKLRELIPALPEYDYWGGDLQALQDLQALTPFLSSELTRLFAIDELSSLSDYSPRLDVYDVDYRNVPIPAGAVVYADPPYAGTTDYGTDFDTVSFWQWVDAQSFPVFVSEYEGAAGFAEVWNTNKRCVLGSAAGSIQTTERLFVQERFASKFRKREPEPQPELLEATA